MEISIIGLLVCGLLLLVGRWFGSPVTIGLFASLSFGGTAFATLHAIGGSSPLIYTLFVMLFLALITLRRNFLRDLGAVFNENWVAWCMLILMVYVVAGAIILPRLFTNEMTVFIPINGNIVERPLAPVSGNITQGAYFVLHGMIFFGFSILCAQRKNMRLLAAGFFMLAYVQATLGLFDIGGKILGISDILAPVRTASYVLHTKTEVAGFWRIAGGYAEASAFGATTLSIFAFMYAYWRQTGQYAAFFGAAILLMLLLLSTSTTAYVGLFLVSVPAALSLLISLVAGRTNTRDLVILVVGIVAVAIIMAMLLRNPNFFDPAVRLFETMVLEKPESASAWERFMWNAKALENAVASGGLGIGIGSSRSSSWLMSTVSQLGVIGSILMGALVYTVLLGLSGYKRSHADSELVALIAALRAYVFAMLVAASLGGSGAVPRVTFFIALAAVCVSRKYLEPSAEKARIWVSAPAAS